MADSLIKTHEQVTMGLPLWFGIAMSLWFTTYAMPHQVE